MKVKLFLFVILGISNYIFGQSASDKIIKKDELDKASTLNLKDAFTYLPQFTVFNLAGEHKSIDLKVNLFDLKTKYNSDLLIDTLFVKNKFARNFQMNFGINLNGNYKMEGIKAGFTYAIVNKRDSAIFKLSDKLGKALAKKDELAIIKMSKFIEDAKCNEDEDKECQKNLGLKINAIKEAQGKARRFVKREDFPEYFQEYLPKDFNKDVDSLNIKLEKEQDNYFKKPLLTVTVNGIFGKEKRFLNQAEANLVYLQGVSDQRKKAEIDIRAGFTVKDTISDKKYYKTEFKSSAGINFSLFSSKDSKSYFEAKPYLEFIKTFGNALFEDKNTFNASADIRIRIVNNMWLPITIKYDLKEGRFLGFLNIVFNWDTFLNPKPSS